MAGQIKKLSIIIGTCAIVLAGCGDGSLRGANNSEGSIAPSVSPSPVASPSTSPTVAPSASVAPSPSHSIAVKGYFLDESGEGLTEQEMNITVTLAEAKYIETLNGLKTSHGKEATSLFEAFTFAAADLQGSHLTIDLSFSPEGQFGAPGERLVVQALQNTVLQFKEIDTFEVLLNGKEVDSLMGHVELPKMIDRNTQW